MIDLKSLVQHKISSIDKLAETFLKAFNVVNFETVTDVLNFSNHQVGDLLSTKQTKWRVTDEETPISLSNGLYLRAIGDVFVEDFNDGSLSQSEYVTKANTYCMSTITGNRLVFDSSVIYNFSADTSFEIYVESGGWYSSGTCRLVWQSAPVTGYAVKIKGRYKYGDNYSSLVNNSNFSPLEGFNIGTYNNMLAGIGLCIGHSSSFSSMDEAVVTSKFTIKRVSIFDFDDVVAFYPGVWACELKQVNTMGGSWRTPYYFRGIDFGESIKLTNCFIADNHRRVEDNQLGTVNFNTGEFVTYGCSFNNMRVVVNGDSVVKMNSPHFENPKSTAKNKRFLEVIGAHAYCVLDKPQIVIRDTPIHSTLFYCKAGTDNNRHPYAGGLVFISPSFNASSNYRPDLAPYQNDGVDYESDGYLELVGGGGRVYLEGGVHINSLFYTYSPIPLARNLVGKSLKQTEGDVPAVDLLSSWQHSEANRSHENKLDTSSLKNGITVKNSEGKNQSVSQKCRSNGGTLVLGSVHYSIEHTGIVVPTSGVRLEIRFYDVDNKELETLYSQQFTINDENDTVKGDFKVLTTVPDSAETLMLALNTFGNGNFTTTWSKLVVNIV